VALWRAARPTPIGRPSPTSSSACRSAFTHDAEGCGCPRSGACRLPGNGGIRNSRIPGRNRRETADGSESDAGLSHSKEKQENEKPKPPEPRKVTEKERQEERRRKLEGEYAEERRTRPIPMILQSGDRRHREPHLFDKEGRLPYNPLERGS